jgi:hypothetical protein
VSEAARILPGLGIRGSLDHHLARQPVQFGPALVIGLEVGKIAPELGRLAVNPPQNVDSGSQQVWPAARRIFHANAESEHGPLDFGWGSHFDIPRMASYCRYFKSLQPMALMNETRGKMRVPAEA